MKKLLFLLLFICSSAHAQTPVVLCEPVTTSGITTCQPISASNPLQISGSITSGVTLGTSASVTNPQKSGDATTGLFSDTTATIEFSNSGTKTVTIGTNGVLIGTPTGGAQGAGTINATNLYVNGVAVGGGGGSGISIGTTTISGGTNTDIEFNNAGVVGEYAISGTGSVCMTTNCSMTTPALGTPSAAILTNATGTASGLTAGNVTTNANLTGVITSVGNATSIASQTGTGTTFVTQASPFITGTVGIGTTSAVSSSNVADFYGSVAIGTNYANTAAPSNGLSVKGAVGIGTTAPVTGFTFQVHTGTDQNFAVAPKLSLANGVQFTSINDANNANEGMEFVTGSAGFFLNSSKTAVNSSTFATGAVFTVGSGAVAIGTSAIQNSTKLDVNGTIESGVAGTTIGGYLLAGNTSGVVSILPQAAAGTYNFNLPITAGSAGQALLSQAGGSTAMTWGTVATGSGGTPTCGTGCASITSGSTDLRGSMVSGSSVSSVTLNFSGTLASAPFCTISDSNTSATADISSISTSALTVSLASALTSVTIYWNCPL